MITSDEIIQETKTVPSLMKKKKNCNEKNATCQTKNLCSLLAFLLITIVLLIAVGIYCYLIKYKVKQKHCHMPHCHITSQTTN